MNVYATKKNGKWLLVKIDWRTSLRYKHWPPALSNEQPRLFDTQKEANQFRDNILIKKGGGKNE